MKTLESFALEYLVSEATGHDVVIFRMYDPADGKFYGYNVFPTEETLFKAVAERVIKMPFETPLEAALKYVQIYSQWNRNDDQYWPENLKEKVSKANCFTVSFEYPLVENNNS